MKVKELITQLMRQDPEVDVILSKDPEGNGYHVINFVETGYFDGYDFYDINSEDAAEFSEHPEVVALWP